MTLTDSRRRNIERNPERTRQEHIRRYENHKDDPRFKAYKALQNKKTRMKHPITDERFNHLLQAAYALP